MSPRGSLNPWVNRISNANKVFEAWEDKFSCRKLVDYYESFQWKGRTDGPGMNYKPYTLNMFYSTIEIKLASFLFQKPSFLVNPEPGHSQWDLDFAVRSAQLKQDVLNTVVKNRNMRFARHLKYSALDTFFYFGIIEVGYSADWRNPQKDDPYLNNWDDPEIPEDKVRVKDQNEVPINERFFIKRIKPERFRVSTSDAEELADHEWVGYWQYYYVDTLRKTPGIKFPKDFDGGSYRSKDDVGAIYKDSSSGLFLTGSSSRAGRRICKVWHIWDLITKERKLILDGYDDDDYELWSQPFERLPLVDRRVVLRREGFYPIPPTWYWLSSQDEINESREQIRSYRRRFTRKFQAEKGAVDEEEMEKFASGPDGVIITVKRPDAIKAIDNPEIGPTSEGALIQAKDDFNLISGTSAEARGQSADRETATQAKILQARAQIRESVEQIDFGEFVGEIGQEIIAQAQEKLVEGLWVKYSTNPSEQPMTDMQNTPYIKWVMAQDISDGYDCTVSIDVKNATPAAMESEEIAFNKFCAMLMQYPFLPMSPVLIREAAYRCGYRNEQVIQQMQQAALAHMAAQNAQQQNSNANGGGGDNPQNTAKAQIETPSNPQITTQLNQQVQ